MSNEELISRAENVPQRSNNTAPLCPKCQRGMMLRQVSPTMFASRADDMVYGCESCGAEVKRTVQRT
jgi:hypothetical protein